MPCIPILAVYHLSIKKQNAGLEKFKVVLDAIGFNSVTYCICFSAYTMVQRCLPVKGIPFNLDFLFKHFTNISIDLDPVLYLYFNFFFL